MGEQENKELEKVEQNSPVSETEVNGIKIAEDVVATIAGSSLGVSANNWQDSRFDFEYYW